MEAQLADLTRVDCRDPAATRLACEAVDTHGYAIFDGLLDAEKVQALHREFISRYPRYLENVEYPETLRVGPWRYQVPIDLRGGFADPEIYGHPLVVAVIRELLGPDAIIEAFGAVVALGHALPQDMHRDGPFLFPGGTHLPCHALTFSLPLVAFDSRVGTTAFWPGSHRRTNFPNLLEPHHMPEVALGSAVLWDFRICHCGEPNFTETVRPVAYATYARAWYPDSRNFHRPGMTRLSLDDDFLSSVPEGRRGLFAQRIAAAMTGT